MTHPTATLPLGQGPSVQAALIGTSNCLSTFIVDCDGACTTFSSATATSASSIQEVGPTTFTLTLGPSLYEVPEYISSSGIQYVASVICSLAPKVVSAVCTTYETLHVDIGHNQTTATGVVPGSSFAPRQVPITFGADLLGTPWSECVPTSTDARGTSSLPTTTNSSQLSTDAGGTNNLPKATSSRPQLSTSEKAGIGVGVGVGGIVLLALGALFYLRRRRKNGPQEFNAEELKSNSDTMEHDGKQLQGPPAELEHMREKCELPVGNELQEMQGDEGAGEMGRRLSTKAASPGIESRHELLAESKHEFPADSTS